MVLYKYDKKPGAKNAPIVDDFDTNHVTGFMENSTFFSMEPEFLTDTGKAYIRDMVSGGFVEYNSSDYKKTVCVEATVVPECKNGLPIVESAGSSKALATVPANDCLIMTTEFNNDNNGNIWGRGLILDDEGGATSGAILYKSSAHNFANVRILDSKFPTVLTGGKIDQSKIDDIVDNAIQPMMMFAMNALTSGPAGTTPTPTTTTAESIEAKVNASYNIGAIKDSSMLNRLSPKNIGSSYANAVAQHAPSIVQNKNAYPKVVGYPTKTNNQYTYDYALHYTAKELDMSTIYKNHNLDVEGIGENTKQNVERYNRFKLAYPDDILSRGFMHIFFTRPDLNYGGSAGQDPFVKYVRARSPRLLDQLMLYNGLDNQFMMLTSNRVTNFPLSDDGLGMGEMGKSRGGYTVAYGRKRDSELGTSINVGFRDNRNFDILHLHKLWIDYIINVFSGKWTPKDHYIDGKILDYAVAAYVIVTAEDFETILFWSKYYGIFPVSIPFSSMQWDYGSPMKPGDLSVTYRYSWKEDWNPAALGEFNMNAFNGTVPGGAQYIPTYNTNIGRIGRTWVTKPFIEFVRGHSGDGSDGAMKLRFQ